MVKGTTRQVLVVRPQESDLFEQAIFLLREEALEQHGAAARRRASSRRACSVTPRRRIPALLYAAMGAASVGLAWLSCVLIF